MLQQNGHPTAGYSDRFARGSQIRNCCIGQTIKPLQKALPGSNQGNDKQPNRQYSLHFDTLSGIAETHDGKA